MRLKLQTLLIALVMLFTLPAISKTPPIAQFSASVYSGCAPLTVSFYNSSTGNGIYSWNFGDPISGPANTSTDCSPTHTFTLPGTYTVVLTYVLGANTYTATQVITVHPLPIATFTGNDTMCSGSIETYTASTPGLSYNWVANGGIINGPNNGSTVNINWTVPGTGYVELTTTNAFGCSKTERIYTLVVPQPNLKDFCDLPRKQDGSAIGEIPNIGKPDSIKDEPAECVCPGTIITFPAMGANNLLLPSSYYTFNWIVTGATIIGTVDTNLVTIQVGNGTSFSVTLIATSPFGCTDTGHCIFPICPKPKASFTNTSGCVGSPINFNASASIGAVSYYWQFGNGNTFSSNGNTATQQYLSAGTYPVKLTVENSDGCKDDTIIYVTVSPGTSPEIGCVGTVCHGQTKCYGTTFFSGATYTWTVTGQFSSTVNAAGDSICITWGNGPLGTIGLSVIGGPYTCNQALVNVPIFPSNIAIYGPDTVCVFETVEYTTDIIPGSCYTWQVTSPGGVTSILNPNTNVGNSTIFNVTGTGIYTIKISMENELTCCKGSAIKQLVVQGPLIITGPLSACEGTSTTYTSNLPVIPSSWNVQGGTITASTANTVTVLWNTAGTGIISATAANPAIVCNNKAKIKVTINPKPLAAPIIGNTVTCQGNTEIFSAITESNVTTTWSYSPTAGTILISSSPNLQVKFNGVNIHTITANYVNTFGCTNTVTANLKVLDTALPVITGPVPACIGSTATYTIPSNPGGYYEWSVIGGQILATTATSVSILWGNISTGQVLVTHKLCGGINYLLVPIKNVPTGIITKSNLTCSGTSVTLCGPPGYSYLWSTGASTQCISATPANAPSVSLQFFTAGCTATISQSLVPFPKLPSPSFTLSKQCIFGPSTPTPIQITANNLIPSQQLTYAWTPSSGAGDTTNQHFTFAQGTTVSVIATNQYGCTTSGSIYTDSCKTGGAPCTPAPTGTLSFTYNPCTGVFTPTVTLPSGTYATTYYWSFGDATYSNLISPTHFYQSLGVKSVEFAVYISNGNCATWIRTTLPVTVNYILRPKIKHSFPGSCNYNTVLLSYNTGNTLLATGTINHLINWDDASTSSGALSQSHTYSSPGTYVISYTVNFAGCFKTVKDTVIVVPFKADFGFCNNSCVGQSLQFYDKSNSSVPIVSWAWNFGDGNTSNLQSPFHIYSSTGPKLVTLTITNQDGCTSTQSYTINIVTFNPGIITYQINSIAVAFANPFNLCQGDILTATAPTGSGLYYSWSTGANTQSINITSSGVYWCTVINGSGCKVKLGPFKVKVNQLPNATIIGNLSACENSSYTLAALMGIGYSYNWTASPVPASFINTNTANPQVYFTSTGPYNFTLLVTNSFGCTAVDNQTVIVNPGPVVNITANTVSPVCTGDSVKLTANVTGAYTGLVWSNGATTSSIWVKANGLYTCTAINANGCTYQGSYYVFNIYLRPDISNVPKGCYEVCSSTGVVNVCGPYSLLGQSLIYNWTHNGNPHSTSPNLSISAPGNYALTVTDAISGCSSTSMPFNVKFINKPVAIIIGNTGNATLCIGQGGVTFNAAPNPIAVTYNWYINGVLVHQGPSYTALDCGELSMVAWLSECCSDTTKVIIDCKNCCFDSTVDFTVINDGTTYTTNTVWQGKYYIAGKVYVQNNAILDLTLVDAVFARQGEIIFKNKTIARFNNSVLRPCEMDSVWEGITFTDSSKGTVQECLFKNAVNALKINSLREFSVRITDNTFSNCNTGVRIRKFDNYQEGITRNSFVIDNTDFTLPRLYGTREFWGIHITGARMQELIAQNEFKNSALSKQLNRYYGVYLIRGAATISENVFSNMFRGIDVITNVDLTRVENNELEQTLYTTDHNFPVNTQIRISDTEVPVLVFANELRNSNKSYRINYGIYASRCAQLNIRDNNIKGFHNGISTRLLNKSVINENDLDNINAFGIYDSSSNLVDINCNIVRLKYVTGTNATNMQLGIYMHRGNNSNRIFSNCVYDCREAIRVQSGSAGIIMPQIFNNYMYNYYRAGIRNLAHVGSIGSAGNPGRNTFISNNANGGAGASDIMSNVAISQSCNQGALYNTALVSTLVCNDNMYSSTASCGQVGVNGSRYKLNHWDICDQYAAGQIILVDHGNGDVKLRKSGDLMVLNPTKDEILAALKMAIAQNDADAYMYWYAALQNPSVPSTYKTIVDALNLAANGNTMQAETMLANAIAATALEQEQINIELALMQIAQSGTISQEMLNKLQTMDNANGTYANAARDILHTLQMEHDHEFEHINAAANAEEIEVPNNEVWVYPNPTTGDANVGVNINAEGKITVALYDMHGKEISQAVVEINSGNYQLKMHNLPAGMYLVRVVNSQTNEATTRKIVKLEMK